jgi:hypothetical protein
MTLRRREETWMEKGENCWTLQKRAFHERRILLRNRQPYPKKMEWEWELKKENKARKKRLKMKEELVEKVE